MYTRSYTQSAKIDLNGESLAQFAQSALPGALPFSFPSWNTGDL